MSYFYYILLAIVSYFIGNINFARVVAKSKKMILQNMVAVTQGP